MKTSILALILVIFVTTGYVKNIFKLTDCDFESPYKCEVVHALGIVIPPVGAITGYIDTETK